MFRFLLMLMISLLCSLEHGILKSGAEDKAIQVGSREADSDNGFTPLNKTKTVMLDVKGKRLLIKSQVVLREGNLEMLVCLKQTKEHESILSVDAQAKIVHAGLLALGAVPGTPVTWQPEFQSATGQKIDVYFTWRDIDGMLHRVPGQSWVRHSTRRYYVEKLEKTPKSFAIPEDSDLKWDSKRREILWFGHMTEAQRDAVLKLSDADDFQKAIQAIFVKSQIRPMTNDWVFAGSQFLTDETTGEKFYQAEGGELICVANFASATLDLSVDSSAANGNLLFEAFTDRIPPIGTDVTIELIPVTKVKEKQP